MNLRHLLLTILLVSGTFIAQAQIKIGDNPGNINTSAVLELESTTKGFLLPRMTGTQMTAIPTPPSGMMIYNTTDSCTYLYRLNRWFSLCAGDSTTASNGLSLVGRDVQLGGTLTSNTTINTGTNNLSVTGAGNLGVGVATPAYKLDVSATADPVRLQGLQGGAQADSIMTVNAATGIIRRRTVADVLTSSNTDNLVWKIDGNLVDQIRKLGTTSNYALPIITNNIERMRITETGNVGIGNTAPTNKLTVTAVADPLKLEGVQGGAAIDSVMTIDASGVVRKRTVADIAAAGVSVENGLSKTGSTIRLGGALNQPTTVTTTATNTLAVAGLQGATSADSVVMADATTGVLRRMTLSDVGANSFTANNGLTKTANNVALGGTLNAATTVATSATNTFGLTGLQGGAATDSVVTVNNASGVIRKRTVADLLNDQNTAWKTTGNAATVAGTNFIGTTDAVDFVTKTNGTERTRVTTAGNMGIGTATPTEKLEVSGGNLKVGNSGTASATITDGTTSGSITTATNATTLATNGTSGLTLAATAAAPVAVATNGSTRMTVTSAGDVGIATATPNSKFQVVGSFALPISNKSAGYTITADDYTIIGDCSGSAFTLTLPDPSTCTGRTYVLIKGDATNNVLTFSRAIYLSSTQSITSINYNVRLHIQSDGTNWWLIARF